MTNWGLIQSDESSTSFTMHQNVWTSDSKWKKKKKENNEEENKQKKTTRTLNKKR